MAGLARRQLGIEKKVVVVEDADARGGRSGKGEVERRR
jgi:hypothetical protein